MTTRSRFILEKLIIPRIVRKLSTFYATRRFITEFTTAHYYSLSWARSIHSTTSQPIYLTSIFTLLSHLSLGVQICLFPSCFPPKPTCTSLLSPTCHMSHPSHSSLFYHSEVYKSWSPSLCSLFYHPVTTSVLGPSRLQQILLQHSRLCWQPFYKL